MILGCVRSLPQLSLLLRTLPQRLVRAGFLQRGGTCGDVCPQRNAFRGEGGILLGNHEPKGTTLFRGDWSVIFTPDGWVRRLGAAWEADALTRLDESLLAKLLRRLRCKGACLLLADTGRRSRLGDGGRLRGGLPGFRLGGGRLGSFAKLGFGDEFTRPGDDSGLFPSRADELGPLCRGGALAFFSRRGRWRRCCRCSDLRHGCVDGRNRRHRRACG